jgi:hypothetical protein
MTIQDTHLAKLAVLKVDLRKQAKLLRDNPKAYFENKATIRKEHELKALHDWNQVKRECQQLRLL